MAISEVWEGYLEVVFEPSEVWMTRVDQLCKELGGQCSWQRLGLVQTSRLGERPVSGTEEKARPEMQGFSDGLQKLLELAEENKLKSRES